MQKCLFHKESKCLYVIQEVHDVATGLFTLARGSELHADHNISLRKVPLQGTPVQAPARDVLTVCSEAVARLARAAAKPCLSKSQLLFSRMLRLNTSKYV